MKIYRKLFKINSLYIVVLLSLCLLPSAAFAQTLATLEDVKGEVLVSKSGSAIGLWEPVTGMTVLGSGDSVKTNNGSCRLVYNGQAADIQVEPNTEFTVQEKAETQDILLTLGQLRAKIDKEKSVKPFQVVTPTAVGAVRGTDVDFGFNDQGLLTVDLKDGGPVQVYNDEAQLNLNLTNNRKITIAYDRQAGILKIKNDCASGGSIEFTILGQNYSESPCEEKEVSLETAVGESTTPGTSTQDIIENPQDEASPPPPVSPVN